MQSRGWQTFSVKSLVISILGFVGHTLSIKDSIRCLLNATLYLENSHREYINEWIYRHALFYCIFLSYNSQILWFVVCVFFFLFHKLNGCGIHALSKPVKAIFATTFAHFMSLLRIGTVLDFCIITIFSMVVCHQ